jgi:hypothetical protein
MADGMSFFQLPRQNYIRGFQARKIEAKAAAAATPAATPIDVQSPSPVPAVAQ